MREIKKDLFFGRILRNEEKALRKFNIKSYSLACQVIFLKKIDKKLKLHYNVNLKKIISIDLLLFGLIIYCYSI